MPVGNPQDVPHDRKDEPLPKVILSLNLTPVSISYEYDPCDQAEARERSGIRAPPAATPRSPAKMT